ncbi:rRNA processing protein Krr1/Pno1 [Mucilaginibacter sp. UYNi724]
MQHLKKFLIRIQTFDLRIIEDDIATETGTNEKKHVKTYDLTYQTQYYDSFSYRSELRVLRDMAFIDLIALDKERIKLQLAELSKVRSRFKEFWSNYNQHYSEMKLVYDRSFIFSVRLDYLFIVNNLQPDRDVIEVTPKFAEDLGDSVKLREKFLMELIYNAENSIKDHLSFEGFQKSLQAKKEEVKQDEEPEKIREPETVFENETLIKPIGRYPTFKPGIALQLLDLLREYFVSEDYASLEKLLLSDEAPDRPLVFRGFGNQLADAFKQLFDARLIVGCQMADLERWIAPKFNYLSNQAEARELTEGYLNGLMSTKTRPCKSPILKIEQKEDKFYILPTPRNKR